MGGMIFSADWLMKVRAVIKKQNEINRLTAGFFCDQNYDEAYFGCNTA